MSSVSNAAATLYGPGPAAPAASAPQERGPAAALYDATPGHAAQPNAQPPRSNDIPPAAAPKPADAAPTGQASALYDAGPKPAHAVNVPPNIVALRAETPPDGATVLYGETLPGCFTQHLGDDSESEGATLAQRTAVAHEVARISRDLGMSDAGEFMDILKQAKSGTAPTAEQAQASMAKAADLLRSEYGDKAQQALADARALVQRDPRVAKLLDAAGLGNDPATVLKFAKLAQRQRAQGRLNK